MDAFGDDFTDSSQLDGERDVDPAAEFLAREHDQLAGLEDDFIAPVEQQQPPAVQDPSDERLFGDATEFDEAYNPPASDGLQNGFGGSQPVAAPVAAARDYSAIPREEPEKIRKWREEQKIRLQAKDEEEERKKKEMRENAQKELEDWYKHHKEAVEKTRLANRNAERELVAQPTELEPGQEWERIAKLCDFNPKTGRNSKDVSRMRSIILQLKQTPPAPSH